MCSLTGKAEYKMLQTESYWSIYCKCYNLAQTLVNIGFMSVWLSVVMSSFYGQQEHTQKTHGWADSLWVFIFIQYRQSNACDFTVKFF